MKIIFVLACALVICSSQQIMDVSYGCNSLCGQLESSYGLYQCPVPGSQKATLSINGNSATLTIVSNLTQQQLPIPLQTMTSTIYYTYMQLPQQLINQIFTLNKCNNPDQHQLCNGGWEYYVQVQDQNCEYGIRTSKPQQVINNLRVQEE